MVTFVLFSCPTGALFSGYGLCLDKNLKGHRTFWGKMNGCEIFRLGKRDIEWENYLFLQLEIEGYGIFWQKFNGTRDPLL